MNYESTIAADGRDPSHGHGPSHGPGRSPSLDTMTADDRSQYDGNQYDSGDYDGGETRPGRAKWVIIALLLIAAIAALAYYFTRDNAAGADDAVDPDSQLPVVTVIAPGRATVEGEISASGTLAARRDIPVGVEGEGGRVVAVSLDAGEWVRQGQVLVSIDRSVQNQQASASAAQVQVAQADARLAQMQSRSRAETGRSRVHLHRRRRSADRDTRCRQCPCARGAGATGRIAGAHVPPQYRRAVIRADSGTQCGTGPDGQRRFPAAVPHRARR